LVEGRANDRVAELAHRCFKKEPDAPLAIVLNRKATRRKGEQQSEDVSMTCYAKSQKRRRDEARLLRSIRNNPK